MFISGGENIYPAEVEAAVVGVADPFWGEVGKAVVALRPGERLSAEELIAFCRDRLAHYKVPKRVEFREALPKSAAGKILKRALRDGAG